MVNEKRFDIGDIVKLKLLGDTHYYIVTDFADFSTENELDVDYEIVLIYPIQENPPIENMIHNELKIVSKFDSRDHIALMDYITRERVMRGFCELPKTVEDAIAQKYQSKNKTTTKSATQSTKTFKRFGAKEIKEILSDTRADERIKELENELDNLLDLLNESIKNEDEEAVATHKEKLEMIHRELMELEYFSLHK